MKVASFILFAFLMVVQAVAEDEPGRLSAQGIGTVTVEPDQGYISVGVVSTKPTSSEAVKANSAEMTRLYESLGSLGVDRKDIKTIEFSVHENYKVVDVDKNQRQVKDGYVVTNMVQITVCKLESFGAILDSITAVGNNAESCANRVNNIGFGSSKATEHMDKARTLAVEDAMKKAKQLSEPLGVVLGSVASVSESGQGPRMTNYNREMSIASANGGDQPPVSGGSLTYSVSVSVVWDLIQPVKDLFVPVK